jgi:hypothetical protein
MNRTLASGVLVVIGMIVLVLGLLGGGDLPLILLGVAIVVGAGALEMLRSRGT